MAKAFSVLSWNVEHFGAVDKKKKKPAKPIEPIVKAIAAQKADVVAIFEVVGSIVFDELVAQMPDYQFHITEGPETQEILVGARKTLSAFFTQKVEFNSGQSTLRPGALLTATVSGASYPLLFLHLKSLTEPKGFGLRDDMTERALKFRVTLDKAAGGTGKSNFLFLGDLNTMGMALTYSKKDVSAEEEIERLEKRVVKKQMTVLEKNRPHTWWPGSKSSLSRGNLDHVVAAKHLAFRSFGGKPVDVRGWPEEPTDAARDAWAKKYSDHAMLYVEVQKV
jgi:hypothetical protein